MEISNHHSLGWLPGQYGPTAISDKASKTFEALLKDQMKAQQIQASSDAGISVLSAYENQTVISSQKTADTTTNTSNDALSVNVGGITVLVSGHSADNRAGIGFISQPARPHLLTSQGSFKEFIANSEVAAGMTVNESVALEAKNIGYKNVSPHGIASGWDVSRTALPLDSHDQAYRGRVEEYAEVISAERELKAIYGNDIKVVYSGADNEYVMLTKDDFGYEDADSTESAVSTILESVRNGSLDRDAVKDILDRFGYQI
ncbi:hypothetical protein ACMXYO_00750 [Neptuniibacter sp. QD37_6]|uniref:hypothetical protein n=1 Tax=Neptuniibacter sp. QD37_6 TaxID=3398210 RepID=UPI0039F60005